MNALQAIEQRRAIKHYDPAHSMTEAEIEQLFSHAVLAPSSFNIQHWRFVAVQNPEIRQQIREAAWNQAHVTDASLLIVLCADTKAWDKSPERYWQHAPQEMRDMFVAKIREFYDGNEQLQRDEALRTAGLAAQTIMLAARAMGYDSCPMIGFDPAKVAEIIKDRKSTRLNSSHV